MLFSAQMGSMVSSFVASVLLARSLEPAEMGRFAFCLSVIVLSGLFFEFGLFSAGARMLALAPDSASERRSLGALVLMAASLGVIFVLFIIIIAGPIDLIFGQNVRKLLFVSSGFGFFQPFQILVELSCQGLNRIRLLSIYQLLISTSFLAIVVVLGVAGRLNEGSALIGSLMGTGIGSVFAIVRLRPTFSGSSSFVRLTLKEARSYGFNIYLARLTGTISSRLDTLIIAYYVGRMAGSLAPLGLYDIGRKLSNPIVTISRVVAVTRFRAFAKLTQVPARIKRWNTVVLAVASIAFVLLGPIAIRLAFPAYIDVIPLLVPLGVLSLFAGLFQPYNQFLASHGRGRDIRNIAIAVTVVGTAGLLLAVPRFGIQGAAWAGAVAMALDYILHLNYYRRFQRSLQSNPNGSS